MLPRQYVVVVFSMSPCVEWPDMPCPMEAYGPVDTQAEAIELARTFPPGFRAHILRLATD